MQELIEKIPAGGSSRRVGVVNTQAGVRGVLVDGNFLQCTWADPMVVDDGDPVEVDFYSSGIGAKAHVQSRTTSQPRPATGEVTLVPPGSPTISISAGGSEYAAEPVGGPYALGDKVHLDWGAGRPRVIGKVTTTTAPPPPVVYQPPPPPPAPPMEGVASAAAVSSRTYWGPGGWGSYAGDGNKVHQGTYGNATVTGAWFYGTQFHHLRGRRITRIEFRTGQRLAIGNHGQPAAFHLWAHTNPEQPGGDTNRAVGPHDFVAAPGQKPEWITLPLSFADTLLNGGGIAIQGEPYAGMQGRTIDSPDSGALKIFWTQ